jgi:hypothetical protein
MAIVVIEEPACTLMQLIIESAPPGAAKQLR